MTIPGKLGWLLSLALAGILALMAYTFTTNSQTEAYSDGRIAILLLPEERNLVLAEMRGFLETAQAIIEASVAGDMEAVTELAKVMGMTAAGDVPPPTMAKLPSEFKVMAAATHMAFDELALGASVSDDPLEVLGDLATLMYNCTACHSTFRLGIEDVDSGE